MRDCKVVITGAGKTSAIAAVSEMPLIQAQPTDLTTSTGLQRIVVEYGELTLIDGVKVGLYGIEGQAQFAYLWQVLLRGATGLIILVKNADEFAWGLANFQEFFEHMPVIVGLPSIDEPWLSAYLQEPGLQVLAVDTGSRASVAQVVHTLVGSHQNH